jgi:cardiolipin-specific phospholipase
MVKLSGKDREIHEFTVERVGEEVQNDMVILHGYGAGLGFFYKNFEPLSRLPGWRLHALDLLGMGRSTRPPFRIHAKDHEGKIREAEDWFIDALEEWRIESKIDKFTLLGHSLGGYMATAYALKYPGRLKKLVLISPVGIPEDPYAVSAELPEPVDSSLQNEFTQNQEEIVDPKIDSKTPRKPLPKWLTYLWDANISPFSIVRFSGPFGPTLISKWTTRRFAHLPPNEAAALHDYSYSLFRQAGSGEYALAYILAPGAFARSPLIRRIQGVGRQPLPVSDTTKSLTSSEPKLENGLPVVLMYGAQDWMDVSGGHDAVIKILEEKEKVLKGKSAEERRQDRG